MTESNDQYGIAARLHRIMAERLRVAAAEQDAAAASVEAAKAMKDLATTYNAGVAREIREHPDLAELNATLDGFYGPE